MSDTTATPGLLLASFSVSITKNDFDTAIRVGNETRWLFDRNEHPDTHAIGQIVSEMVYTQVKHQLLNPGEVL